MEQAICITTETPKAFFHDRVVAAEKRQQLELGENLQFYLVNLLVDFLRVDSGCYTDCLALTFQKAVESPQGEQILLYRRLGDTSLYFAGFFQEFFHRKTFDVGYYVMMGQNAYDRLAGILARKSARDRALAETYSELAGRFTEAVDILMDVSEHTGVPQEPRSTLSLYEAWLKTASDKLEQELVDRGFTPIKVPTTIN